MSYDFATQRLCTHEVFFEKVALAQSTRLTAPFPRPPANSQVRVFVDRVEVPRAGLWSHAELPFSRREPYRIRRGENDLILVALGFAAPRLVQLLPGPEVRARDMVRELQRQFPDLIVEDKNGHVNFRTRTPFNGTAFQFHDPRWTDRTESLPSTGCILKAYESIGVVPGRAVTGQRLFPGWIVERDTDSPLATDRRLAFSDVLRNADPVIELCYVTSAPNCRRCFGSRVEFDYTIKDSTYETVRDTDLLAQEFDKFIYTRRGSHFKWPWLGSRIVDLIGGKGDTATLTMNAMVNMELAQAFSSYQNVKQQQLQKSPGQRVSNAEYPDKLDGINFTPVPEDPTVVVVTTSVRSLSQTPVPLQRLVGLPDPLTLSGGVRKNLLLANEPFHRRG